MHIEFLVEEESSAAALQLLVPTIVGHSATFDIHPFQGKQDLMGSLVARLTGYAPWLPDDWRIVVLVDRDTEDCRALKRKLEAAARQAGLITKSRASVGSQCRVLNRIAIEELEAWFFGDVEALRAAYPRLPSTLANKQGFRDPDAIKGGTWERLGQQLQSAGYYGAGVPKVEVARNVAAGMDPKRNRSHSFRVFRDGLRDLVAT